MCCDCIDQCVAEEGDDEFAVSGSGESGSLPILPLSLVQCALSVYHSPNFCWSIYHHFGRAGIIAAIIIIDWPLVPLRSSSIASASLSRPAN
jgi:hypothetical protein